MHNVLKPSASKAVATPHLKSPLSQLLSAANQAINQTINQAINQTHCRHRRWRYGPRWPACVLAGLMVLLPLPAAFAQAASPTLNQPALAVFSAAPVSPAAPAVPVHAASAVDDAAHAEMASGALPKAPADLNETVVSIPVGNTGVLLETTIFRPDGNGPFPVVVFNHGKERGDPAQQPRSRPLPFAREFVRRGYMVVAPNREGFAHSGGIYQERLCGLDEIGLQQARDVTATVHYVQQMRDADASRILIAGTSQGGLATIAYGTEAVKGVRGLINFAGGLRQDGCAQWQAAMIDAFRAYGAQVRLPSLWFYGDNDQFWPQPLARQLLAVYHEGGAPAQLVDFGTYKDNAHRLVGDRDGVPLWLPSVDAFLQRIGMPSAPRYQIPTTPLPPATNFARITDVDAVPWLDASGRAGYLTFLQQYPGRAFAISETGAWSWAEGGDDPEAVALDNCQRNSRQPCRLYAVNHHVVWTPR